MLSVDEESVSSWKTLALFMHLWTSGPAWWQLDVQYCLRFLHGHAFLPRSLKYIPLHTQVVIFSRGAPAATFSISLCSKSWTVKLLPAVSILMNLENYKRALKNGYYVQCKQTPRVRSTECNAPLKQHLLN